MDEHSYRVPAKEIAQQLNDIAPGDTVEIRRIRAGVPTVLATTTLPSLPAAIIGTFTRGIGHAGIHFVLGIDEDLLATDAQKARLQELQKQRIVREVEETPF